MSAEPDEEPADVHVGGIYEDCAYHPVLCTHVHDDRSVSGISLIDASAPRTCDLDNCGVRVIAMEEVLEARLNFELYVAKRQAEDQPAQSGPAGEKGTHS